MLCDIAALALTCWISRRYQEAIFFQFNQQMMLKLGPQKILRDPLIDRSAVVCAFFLGTRLLGVLSGVPVSLM